MPDEEDVRDAAPDADEELAEGEALLAEGDLDEALMRAARAVAVAPERSDVVAFANKAIAAHRDPLAVLKLARGAPFGVVALRARALAYRQRWMDAAEVTFDVAAFRPSLAYLSWVPPWLAQIEESMSPADADRLVGFVVHFVNAAVGGDPSDAGLHRNFVAASSILAVIEPRSSRKSRVAIVRAFLLRRLGRAREAVPIAEGAYATEPSWATAVELANTYRDAGRLEEAVTFFRLATDLDRSDCTAWLDLADVLLSMARDVEAEAAYAHVLEAEPRHPVAGPSRLYVALRRGDPTALDALRAMAAQSGEAGNLARGLLARVGVLHCRDQGRGA